MILTVPTGEQLELVPPVGAEVVALDGDYPFGVRVQGIILGRFLARSLANAYVASLDLIAGVEAREVAKSRKAPPVA